MGSRSGVRLRDIPTRLATGAYILHSGITKLKAGPEQVAGVYGGATGAFPALKRIPPQRFVRMLAIGEITVGSLLLVPFIPTWVAAAALTVFSSGLVGMYLRTPALRKPGSIWPSQAGTAISKDSWMLAIGLGMLIGSAEDDGD
ncbi:DoxX family protein [Microbacterium protaetiae]|uniref:DoxX family protein n=1 Tax=Microbacterium protaetiae TaxID=2509458 RepID=A0A4P6ENP7_9MICO|nr:DoxX family protein [Microbacterium protaetiae]QAY59518.1 DoxX family protein [Microbacterium protaetiae]